MLSVCAHASPHSCLRPAERRIVEQSRLRQARERQWGDERALGMRMEERAGACLPSCTGSQTSTRTSQVRTTRSCCWLGPSFHTDTQHTRHMQRRDLGIQPVHRYELSS